VHHWISDPTDLTARLARRPARVGLDTEFIRERTYWPQLALVQIAIEDDILLVDPLVPGMCEALAPMLADRHILKVMHSASEDIVAFKRACGVAPTPLFDTQIAAGLAGIGAGMGYQRIVQDLLHVTLEKGEQRSDWLRRPLTASQLDYAADDVVHLDAIYRALASKLDELGRRAWLDEDSARLAAGADENGERWPHLSMRSAQFLDMAAQRRLLRLLRWRDAYARTNDRPRTWILDNELATALARNPPIDRDGLKRQMDATPKSPKSLLDPIWTALTTPWRMKRKRRPRRRTNATRSRCASCRTPRRKWRASLDCRMACWRRVVGWRRCWMATIGRARSRVGAVSCWSRGSSRCLRRTPRAEHQGAAINPRFAANSCNWKSDCSRSLL